MIFPFSSKEPERSRRNLARGPTGRVSRGGIVVACGELRPATAMRRRGGRDGEATEATATAVAEVSGIGEPERDPTVQ